MITPLPGLTGAPAPSPPAAAPTPPATTGATAPRADAAVDARIADAARQMEGFFLSMLTEEMLKGTSVAEAGPVYSGLITQQLGESLADSGGLGLAARLERDLGARP